jgi:metal-responsive CopG/Arc/MetJ family transcriptional regulator
MAKISIYLDEQRLKELDELVDNYPHLTKRSRLVKYRTYALTEKKKSVVSDMILMLLIT